MGDPMLAIGMISGTSMDGIDLALIRTDGVDFVEPLGFASYPYCASLRRSLGDLMTSPQIAEHDPLVDIEQATTDAFVDAIRRFRDELPLAREAQLIGSHGQTVWHNPEAGFTRQLGFGAQMAQILETDVVDRFRHNDLAMGGQGAPLVPVYHRALAKDLSWPAVFLNLGGVGNLTYIDQNHLLAFDTGPASGMIDDYVNLQFQQPFDRDGIIAARGQIDMDWLNSAMLHPYFQLPPPKSLDRQAFVDLMVNLPNDPQDAVASLTAFTIASIVKAQNHFPQAPRQFFVCGGGRLNKTIMKGLIEQIEADVKPIEDLERNGDAIEAECFAYLAVRSVFKLPISFQTTTGVSKPLTGGQFHSKDQI